MKTITEALTMVKADKMVLFATILAVLVCIGAAEKDESMVKGAHGRAVVEATISKIEKQCFFKNDKLFIRRLAYVETTDGTDYNTFNDGLNGGIWKIDKDQFELTKTYFYLDKLNSHFNVDWKKVQYSDLAKPFYSALAAYVYNEQKVYIELHFRFPISIGEQANFWNTQYDHEKARNFGSKASELQKSLCKLGSTDAIFVVDGSNRVKEHDFNNIKNFIKKFINSYHVGSDAASHTRFALYQLRQSVKADFGFEDYNNKRDYGYALDMLKQAKEGPDVGKTFEYIADRGFSVDRGARASGVSRMVVLITSGKSNNEAATIAAAKKLHDKNIEVYAIAAGSKRQHDQLRLIVSQPDCLHFNFLTYFHELAPKDPSAFVCQKTTNSATTKSSEITACQSSGSGYVCDNRNPCTAENIVEGKFYRAHHERSKFEQCYVMKCSLGQVWDQTNLNCF